MKTGGNPMERSKDKRARSRSSTGCLTCRRKRKKCDEKLYPTCLRCQDKQLVCEWPLKVQEIQQQLGHVRYVGNDGPDENPKQKLSIKSQESQKPPVSSDVSSGILLNTNPNDSQASNSYAPSKPEAPSDAFMDFNPVDFNYSLDKTDVSYGLSHPVDMTFPSHQLPPQQSQQPQQPQPLDPPLVGTPKEILSQPSEIATPVASTPPTMKSQSKQLEASTKKRSYLERIALQQDCVDDL